MVMGSNPLDACVNLQKKKKEKKKKRVTLHPPKGHSINVCYALLSKVIIQSRIINTGHG